MRTSKTLFNYSFNKPFADCTGCSRLDHRTVVADPRIVAAGYHGYRHTVGCCWQPRCNVGR